MGRVRVIGTCHVTASTMKGEDMLSCSCEYDGGSWWYIPPNDFTTLKTKRRRRCCSCGNLIDIDAPCLELKRYCEPRSNIEELIYCDEVSIASWWLCESCGEIYLNLNAIGYCYWAGEDLREYIKEYWNLTGFIPKDKK